MIPVQRGAVEDIDHELAKLRTRQAIVADHLTPNSVDEYRELTARIDELLDLRLAVR